MPAWANQHLKPLTLACALVGHGAHLWVRGAHLSGPSALWHPTSTVCTFVPCANSSLERCRDSANAYDRHLSLVHPCYYGGFSALLSRLRPLVWREWTVKPLAGFPVRSRSPASRDPILAHCIPFLLSAAQPSIHPSPGINLPRGLPFGAWLLSSFLGAAQTTVTRIAAAALSKPGLHSFQLTCYPPLSRPAHSLLWLCPSLLLSF